MKKTILTLAASAGALALGTAAHAATAFTANIEIDQSTTESPGYTDQFGQASLVLVDNEDGSQSLAMTVTFTGALDFSGIVASGQIDEVIGTDNGAGGEVVTGFHIHDGDRGESGPVVFSLFDTALGLGTSDTDADTVLDFGAGDGTISISSTWDIDEGTADGVLSDFLGELLAATTGEDVGLYFNLHTVAAPMGLIRGQVVATNDITNAVPLPAALPLFGAGLAALGVARRRKARA